MLKLEKYYIAEIISLFTFAFLIPADKLNWKA